MLCLIKENKKDKKEKKGKKKVKKKIKKKIQSLHLFGSFKKMIGLPK